MLDLGGTVRTHAARETLARVAPLLPRFGITRLAAQEGLTAIKIPVTICYRPNARGQSTSQGKGITRELADVSAIMEAIELFHAERLPPADVTASVAELREPFVDPEELPHVSVYRPGDRLGWLRVTRVAGGSILVPRDYLDLDRTRACVAFDATSNGLASGNTIDEAIVHGLYELIERHCFTTYMELPVAERRARTVALDTVTAPHVRELMQRLADAGLGLSVRALHDALGIPAFRARIQPLDPDDRTPGTSGFGAHFVPEVALARAITETVQGRITKIAGSRDDFYPHTYHYIDLAILSGRTATLEAGVLPWSAIPRPPMFDNFAEVLAWTTALLERHGFTDTCFLDVGRPELSDLPIVFVVSPRLRFDRNVFYRAELE